MKSFWVRFIIAIAITTVGNLFLMWDTVAYHLGDNDYTNIYLMLFVTGLWWFYTVKLLAVHELSL